MVCLDRRRIILGIKRNTMKQATSSAYLIRSLLNFAASRGADTGEIIAALDLHESVLDDENARVTVETAAGIWDEISRKIGDRFLGLHFGEALGLHGERHFLFTLMKNCRTLKEGLESLIRYHRLMTDLVRPRLVVHGPDAAIEVESALPDSTANRHVSESVMGLLAVILRNIAGEGPVFREIQFTHEGADDTGEYERIFSLKPVFRSSGNRMILEKNMLDRALPMAHREFHAFIRHYAEVLDARLFNDAGFADKAALFIKKTILSGGDYSLGAVSERFTLGERQVQNRLKNEGTSYRVLLDGARKDIALHLLKQKDVLLIDIAFMLGFSDQSSFNRAFRKWTGGTPGAIQNKRTR